MILAQATQPSGIASWTPEQWALLIGAICTLISLIKSFRADAKADINSQRITNTSTQVTSHDAQLTELALHTSAPLKSTPATDVMGNRPVPTPERISGAFDMASPPPIGADASKSDST